MILLRLFNGQYGSFNDDIMTDNLTTANSSSFLSAHRKKYYSSRLSSPIEVSPSVPARKGFSSKTTKPQKLRPQSRECLRADLKPTCNQTELKSLSLDEILSVDAKSDCDENDYVDVGAYEESTEYLRTTAHEKASQVSFAELYDGGKEVNNMKKKLAHDSKLSNTTDSVIQNHENEITVYFDEVEEYSILSDSEGIIVDGQSENSSVNEKVDKACEDLWRVPDTISLKESLEAQTSQPLDPTKLRHILFSDFEQLKSKQNINDLQSKSTRQNGSDLEVGDELESDTDVESDADSDWKPISSKVCSNRRQRRKTKTDAVTSKNPSSTRTKKKTHFLKQSQLSSSKEHSHPKTTSSRSKENVILSQSSRLHKNNLDEPDGISLFREKVKSGKRKTADATASQFFTSKVVNLDVNRGKVEICKDTIADPNASKNPFSASNRKNLFVASKVEICKDTIADSNSSKNPFSDSDSDSDEDFESSTSKIDDIPKQKRKGTKACDMYSINPFIDSDSSSDFEQSISRVSIHRESDKKTNVIKSKNPFSDSESDGELFSCKKVNGKKIKKRKKRTASLQNVFIDSCTCSDSDIEISNKRKYDLSKQCKTQKIEAIAPKNPFSDSDTDTEPGLESSNSKIVAPSYIRNRGITNTITSNYRPHRKADSVGRPTLKHSRLRKKAMSDFALEKDSLGINDDDGKQPKFTYIDAFNESDTEMDSDPDSDWEPSRSKALYKKCNRLNRTKIDPNREKMSHSNMNRNSDINITKSNNVYQEANPVDTNNEEFSEDQTGIETSTRKQAAKFRTMYTNQFSASDIETENDSDSNFTPSNSDED